LSRHKYISGGFFGPEKRKKEKKKRAAIYRVPVSLQATSPSRHTVTSLTISGSEPDISIQAIKKFWMGSHSGQ